jgi:hypothetical protein
MAQYAKRTCFNCGIRLPQPELRRLFIERFSVRGNELPAREEWTCNNCYPAMKHRDPYLRSNEENEKRRLNKILDEQSERDRNGKEKWAIEQESRRQANIAKRNSNT